MDINKYINGKSVKRLVIANDIVNNKITRNEIKQLCEKLSEFMNNGNLEGVFLGNSFELKKNKSEWNNEFLNELKNKSVSEVFNEEYLLFLHEVTSFLNNEKKRKVTLISLICIILVLLIVMCCVIKSNKEISNNFPISKYIDGKEVEKTFIACDIAYGKISQEQLEILIKELNNKKKIKTKKLYVSTKVDKLSKSEWDELYLEELIKRAG